MGSKSENDRQATIADDALYEFETPTSDLERISSPIPPPDENGLFNKEGVLALARRRGIVECADAEIVARGVDNFVITLVLDPVRSDVGDVRLTAIAPGKWEPVAILEACGELNGLDNFNINYSVARPRNHDDLDELKIARIVAAEGLNPYLFEKVTLSHLIDERGGYNFNSQLTISSSGSNANFPITCSQLRLATRLGTSLHFLTACLIAHYQVGIPGLPDGSALSGPFGTQAF